MFKKKFNILFLHYFFFIKKYIQANPFLTPNELPSLVKYGYKIKIPEFPKEGAERLVKIFNPRNEIVYKRVVNYYIPPHSFKNAFLEVGFNDFQFMQFEMNPLQQQNKHLFEDFLKQPNVIMFKATK